MGGERLKFGFGALVVFSNVLHGSGAIVGFRVYRFRVYRFIGLGFIGLGFRVYRFRV